MENLSISDEKLIQTNLEVIRGFANAVLSASDNVVLKNKELVGQGILNCIDIIEDMYHKHGNSMHDAIEKEDIVNLVMGIEMPSFELAEKYIKNGIGCVSGYGNDWEWYPVALKNMSVSELLEIYKEMKNYGKEK